MLGANLFFIGYRLPIGPDELNAIDLSWFDTYFAKLAQHGINFLRIWFRAPEQFKNEENSRHLDYVINAAAANNIKIDFTIFIESAWDWTLNNETNEITNWTDDESKAIIDYVVQRWGSSPALGFWDICNEPQLKRPSSIVEPWLDTMEDYLREVDNNRHPVLLQLNTGRSILGAGVKHMLDNLDSLSIRAY